MTITLIPWEGEILQYMEWDEWVDPLLPVTGPPPAWPYIDTQAGHYTAAVNLIDGDPGENWAGIPGYLRSIHRDYMFNRPSYDENGQLIRRGYAIGYNHGVDQRGVIWKLRGWSIACAANKGWNPRTMAVLCLVDGQDPLSDAAARAFRYLHWKQEQLGGRPMTQRPHSQLDDNGQVLPWPGNQTQCCGDGIRGQMAVNYLNWRWYDLQPIPTPDPITLEADMFTAVIKGTSPDRHAVLLTVNGSDVGMTGLTAKADETAMCKALDQSATITVGDYLWDDWYLKAVQSIEAKKALANG